MIGLDGVLSEETLSVALWGVIKNFNNPVDIIGKVIAYGGDCDTIGSISGQFAGLLFGDKILNNWIENIENKDLFIELYNKIKISS